MTDAPESLPPLSDEERAGRKYRNVGVGCFTTFIGFFGGAMTAVMLSKIVAQYQNAPQCEGIPTCDWVTWAARGGVLGMIILPTVSVWRLVRGDAARDRSRSA